MQIIDAEIFIKESRETPVADVRSPSEFAEGHIPGAVNIPLFDDKERAVVGTLYKNRGRQQAIETGLEIVGPKLSELSKIASGTAVDGKLLLHCWRGGMRSESIAWLVERLGIKCSILQGGYKAYRNYLLEETGKISNLIVIEGSTGSGKTEILRELESMGEQIIDLEELANHKGSVFGGIGKIGQPTTQQFQNNLLKEVLKHDRSKRIWVEAESRAIGKVFLPDSFWQRMTEALVIEIKVPYSERIERLLSEYGKCPKEEMENAIISLSRRIGEVRMKEILEFYKAGNLISVAGELLNYYDKMYHSSRLNYKGRGIEIILPDGNAEQNAKLLLEGLSKIDIQNNEPN